MTLRWLLLVMSLRVLLGSRFSRFLASPLSVRILSPPRLSRLIHLFAGGERYFRRRSISTAEELPYASRYFTAVSPGVRERSPPAEGPEHLASLGSDSGSSPGGGDDTGRTDRRSVTARRLSSGDCVGFDKETLSILSPPRSADVAGQTVVFPSDRSFFPNFVENGDPSSMLGRIGSSGQCSPYIQTESCGSSNPCNTCGLCGPSNLCGQVVRVTQSGEPTAFSGIIECQGSDYDMGGESLRVLAVGGFFQIDTSMNAFLSSYVPQTSAVGGLGFGELEDIPPFLGDFMSGDFEVAPTSGSGVRFVHKSRSMRVYSVREMDAGIRLGPIEVSHPVDLFVLNTPSARLLLCVAELQSASADYVRDMSGMPSRLAASEDRIRALEVEIARLSSVVDEERVVRERERVRFDADRTTLEAVADDVISQWDSGIAACREAVDTDGRVRS